LPNNEWAVQRRGGAAESRANNVIYIGRASFRMEPAPLTADEIDQPPAHALDHHVDAIDAEHGAGEDVEPPYLRLRTLIDESLGKDTEGQQAPELDLTEFAVVAENTGVEIVQRDAPPPFPRTLIADVASFPHAMPTGFDPSTELLVPARNGLSLSRARLIGWGALAFCAGLVASAGAHMLAAPARIGATANAATATAATTTRAPAPAPAAAPAVAAAAAPTPVAAEPVAAPAATAPAATNSDATAAKTVASDTAGAELQPVLAVPAPLRTRSGAAAQAHAQTRARGKMRSVPRGGSADALSADESSSVSPATDDAPAAPAKTHRAAGWVDPFAE